MFNTNSQTKLKTAMLKSSLCDYSGAYILVKTNITVAGAGAIGTAIQADVDKKAVEMSKL